MLLYHIVSHYIILYHIISYCVILCYIVLCYVYRILYHISFCLHPFVPHLRLPDIASTIALPPIASHRFVPHRTTCDSLACHGMAWQLFRKMSMKWSVTWVHCPPTRANRVQVCNEASYCAVWYSTSYYYTTSHMHWRAMVTSCTYDVNVLACYTCWRPCRLAYLRLCAMHV